MPKVNPNSMPYPRLVNQIGKACAAMRVDGIDRFDVAAVCIKESMGNPFFCPCDTLFKVNLNALALGSTVNGAAFTDFIRIKSGGNKGSIPKFRFEASWFKLVEYDAALRHLSRMQKALYSCSIGVGQKSILYLMEGHKAPYDASYLDQFLCDPDMQVRQVMADLAQCLRSAGGKRALAFTKYNAGCGCHHVTPYGEQVEAVADNLRLLYAREIVDGRSPPST